MTVGITSQMHQPRTVKRALALAACSLCLPVFGEVKIAVPFSEHMVLQRDQPVPIWGQAAAGESVTVEFAGQSKTIQAGGDGKWMVTLGPMAAEIGGRTMMVKGANTISLNDVLVGEVWLCSGQSNMEASLERLKTTKAVSREAASAGLKRIEQEVASTTPGIRLFRMGTNKNDLGKNQWTYCNPVALKKQVPSGIQGFSAVAYFFGKELGQELKVPIGLIQAAVGGSVIETWTPPEGKNFRPMVRPLSPFAIRGVIWYQGESNVTAGDDAAAYGAKMETLIKTWREIWKQPQMPFYYVQLPPMAYSKRRGKILLSAEALPYFREGQASVLRLPQTGMVITTDLADPSDIHPMNKWDVGHRLALLALAKTYSRPNVVFSGPVYTGIEIKGAKAILSFSQTGGGLVARNGGTLTGFTIAGTDGKFQKADAVIEGDKVIVSSPQVLAPALIRFCWHEAAAPNLFNRVGLPAAPFRTDSLPQAKRLE